MISESSAFPDEILLKKGVLDEKEYEIIKNHTILGNELLSKSSSSILKFGSVIALNHHEQFNGEGYPNRLKKEAIPIEARIVAVADVFDAMTSPRPYRPAWNIENVIDVINQKSGSHFDPNCVDALMQNINNKILSQPDPKITTRIQL